LRKEIRDVGNEIKADLLIYEACFIGNFIESSSNFLTMGKKGLWIIFGFLARKRKG